VGGREWEGESGRERVGGRVWEGESGRERVRASPQFASPHLKGGPRECPANEDVGTILREALGIERGVRVRERR
jgi:hypothetical protein